MSKLTNWINTQLNQYSWGYNELARQAGLSSGTISNLMANRTKPGLDLCIGIARAFNVSPEGVLRLAGLLPSIPINAIQEEKMLYAFRQLDPDEQDLAIAAVRGMAQHKDNDHE